MPKNQFTITEGAARAPDLLALIREVVDAARKNSPGGVRITPEEWLGIGEEIGILVARVAKDAAD